LLFEFLLLLVSINFFPIIFLPNPTVDVLLFLSVEKISILSVDHEILAILLVILVFRFRFIYTLKEQPDESLAANGNLTIAPSCVSSAT